MFRLSSSGSAQNMAASKQESSHLHPPCKTCCEILCSSNTASWLWPAFKKPMHRCRRTTTQLGAQFPYQKRERTGKPVLLELVLKATSLLYPPGDARDGDGLACACKEVLLTGYIDTMSDAKKAIS